VISNDSDASFREVHAPHLAYAMRALGRGEFPAVLLLESAEYRLVRTIKHDFFAATGLYANSADEKVVLKMGRTTAFAGIPLAWLGRFLQRRELHFYRRLGDLPSVPHLFGTVGRSGFVMQFVEGSPLSEASAVPDHFFDELMALIGELHRRGIAYVDTNKPQNILLGSDGKPYLIDFQISWDIQRLGNIFPNRWLLRRLQADDVYHLLKHKRRLRRDEMSDADREQLGSKSAFIRTHRRLTRPYFWVRRRLFKRLRDTGQLLPEGSK
jgi:hypothetical protein